MISEREPRVVLLIHSLDVGGAQRSIMTISAAWPPTSDCQIVAARSGSLLEQAREVTRTRVVATSWPRLRGVARFILCVRLIARSERPDAFLTNSFGVARVVLLAKTLRCTGDAAVVVVERNTLSVKVQGLYRSRLTRHAVLRLTRWLYRRADAIIGVSEGVSRDLERTLDLPAGSVTTIYNPVDTGQIIQAVSHPVPDELQFAFNALPRPTVITSGRLVRAKAHRDLIEAFAQLPDNQRGSLVILGEGPLRGDLENQVALLGISDRVWMPGFVENPWWFIARSDVFALSSHWEGHPRAILEAIACGIPIVSTDCPSGPRELLSDVPGTRLTPVGDPKALAHATQELLSRHEAPSIDLSRYHPRHTAHLYVGVIDALNQGYEH